MKSRKFLLITATIVLFEMMALAGCGSGDNRGGGTADGCADAASAPAWQYDGISDIAGTAVASPRIPIDMSWAGTREIAIGTLDAALNAVINDTPATVVDTLLQLLKLGAINAALGNGDSAVAMLNVVRTRSSILAPLAMDLSGDIHAAKRDNAAALEAYSLALAPANLPVGYRRHIFAKIERLESGGAVLGRRAWIDEYRRWERTQRKFDIDALEALYDSLINADQTARADSVLARHWSELDLHNACRLADRIFGARETDPQTSAAFPFTVAAQANECRNFPLSQRMYAAARARPDFSRAIPARDALMLSANMAYSASKWEEAAELFQRFHATYGPDTDALIHLARSHRNSGDSVEAKKWYDLHVRHFPTHRRTHEIHWLRAWDFEMSGQYREAAAAYRGIFNTRGHNRSEEARIRHALSFYKMGEFDSVVTHLGAFIRANPNSNQRFSAMFWQGKAHAAAGNIEAAHRVWNSIADLDPIDYHAHRARQIMGVDHQITTPAAAQMTEEQSRAWLDRVSPSTKKRLSSQDTVNLRRGAALLAIAEPDIAHFFLDNYARNFAGNLRLQFEIAAGYALAGSPALSFVVANRFWWRIPMEHRNSRPLHVLAIMHPPFYSHFTTRYAHRFDSDPFFVSAVIRHESIFNRQLVSHVGAIGLMQIMPATGRDIIAVELNEPFTVDSLYNAAYNVRFGTYYLSKRYRQFDDSHVLALCSYNGGAHNAARWLERRTDPDDDIFAEDIGFRETRMYVKRVMGSYWTYKILAEMPGYEYHPSIRANGQ